MINLHLREIRSFVGLADTGSFRLAAEKLGISQPALSAHIRNLELTYDVSLVHRTTRQVTLTPEGRTFASQARRALTDLEAATQGLREISAAHRGHVYVACIPPITASFMPQVMLALHEAYPAVDVTIRDILSTQVAPMVIDHGADIGICPADVPVDVTFEKLLRDEFVVAVPRGHALENRTEISLAEVVDQPLVLNSRDTNTRRILDRAFDRINRTVKPRYEFTHYRSVGSFVAAGLGVTVLPQTVVSSLANEDIVALKLKDVQVYRDLGLITRRAYEPSPAARVLIKILKKTFAGVVSG